MAKSKDRLMLEELFRAASVSNLYKDSCDDGKDHAETSHRNWSSPVRAFDWEAFLLLCTKRVMLRARKKKARLL